VSRANHFLTAATEFSALGVGLWATMNLSPFATVPLALVLMLLGLFTAFTGRGLPILRGRMKGVAVFLVAGMFAVAASQAYVEQRETRWGELRKANPDAYLAELAPIDGTRWLSELRELRPDQYRQEVARRETEAEALRQTADAEAARQAKAQEVERKAAEERAAQEDESRQVDADRRAQAEVEARLRQCTDAKAGEAFVMIQSDVRRALVAPSTAVFPSRAGQGTRHIGNCLFQVNGYFDAQNGFGAMLRGTFSGTTKYFPEQGSWQTQSLNVN